MMLSTSLYFSFSICTNENNKCPLLNEMKWGLIWARPSSGPGSLEALNKCYLLLIQSWYSTAAIAALYIFGGTTRSMSRPAITCSCDCHSKTLRVRTVPAALSKKGGTGELQAHPHHSSNCFGPSFTQENRIFVFSALTKMEIMLRL